MKLVVVFCTGACEGRLRDVLESHGVHAYTEIPDVLGAGVTGRHFGSRAWPGASHVLLAVVDDGKAGEVLDAVEAFVKECLPDQGARAILMPVERMV